MRSSLEVGSSDFLRPSDFLHNKYHIVSSQAGDPPEETQVAKKARTGKYDLTSLNLAHVVHCQRQRRDRSTRTSSASVAQQQWYVLVRSRMLPG